MSTAASRDRTFQPPAGAPSLVQRAVERIGIHNLSLILALVVLAAIFGTIRSDVFFSGRNVLNIGLGITILGILAISQTVVIISGALDISVGSIVGLTTVACALAIETTASPLAGIFAGIAVGAAAGLANGVIITIGRVNAVIATLSGVPRLPVESHRWAEHLCPRRQPGCRALFRHQPHELPHRGLYGERRGGHAASTKCGAL